MIDNLNQYFQPKDAPVSQDRGYLPSTDFDSQYKIPPGAINYTNSTISSRPYAAIVTISGEAGTFKNIQLAINYVHSYGGGTVFVRNGTYTLSSNITLYDDISLIGESNINVVFDFNSTSFHIDTNLSAFFRIKDIRISNCRSTTGALYFNNSSNGIIENVYFLNNTDAGGNDYDIYITGSTGSTFSNCSSINAGSFVFSSGASDMNFLNNYISGTLKNGFDGATSGLLTGNFFLNCVGPSINGACTQSRIIGNIFQSNANTSQLILLTGGIENQIIGNNFRTTATNKDVIKLQTSSFDNQIVGNFMVANGAGKCVIFNASADTNNTLVGNRLNGSYTDNGLANVISGNS